MTKEAWKNLITLSAMDEKKLDRLAEDLYQKDKAMQIFSDKGYRVTGMSLLETAERAPSLFRKK